MKRRDFLNGCAVSVALPVVLPVWAGGGPNTYANCVFELDDRFASSFSSERAFPSGSESSVVWRNRPTGQFWCGNNVQQHSRYANSPSARGGMLLGAVDESSWPQRLDDVSGVIIGANRGYLFVNSAKVSKRQLFGGGPGEFERNGFRARLYVDNSAQSALNDWMLPYLIGTGAIGVGSGEGSTFFHGELASAIKADLIYFELVAAHAGGASCDFDELYDASSDLAAIYASVVDWQNYLGSTGFPDSVRKITFAVSPERFLMPVKAVAPVVDRLQFGANFNEPFDRILGERFSSHVLNIAAVLRKSLREKYDYSFIDGMDPPKVCGQDLICSAEGAMAYAGGTEVPYFFTALSSALADKQVSTAVAYAVASANYYVG